MPSIGSHPANYTVTIRAHKDSLLRVSVAQRVRPWTISSRLARVLHLHSLAMPCLRFPRGGDRWGVQGRLTDPPELHADNWDSSTSPQPESETLLLIRRRSRTVPTLHPDRGGDLFGHPEPRAISSPLVPVVCAGPASLTLDLTKTVGSSLNVQLRGFRVIRTATGVTLTGTSCLA